MKSLGARAQGLRLERMHASPLWTGAGFRNLHPVLPGLRDATAERPTLSEFICHAGRRVPQGPLPSHDPRQAWLSAAQSGLRVGAFHPSWGDIHLGPENALKALQLLTANGPAPAFLARALGHLQPRIARLGCARRDTLRVGAAARRTAAHAAPGRSCRTGQR